MAVALPIEIYTRRAWLISFWSVISLVVGVMAGTFLWGLSLPHKIALGSATALAVAMPGFVRPSLVIIPLRAWNRLARLFAHGATFWLTSIWFYVVFSTIGRMGSSLRLARPSGESLWLPWVGGAAGGRDADVQGISMPSSSENGWLFDYFGWARRSRNMWAWGLLPFLLVLGALETSPREVEAPPAGIYTLY